MSSSVRKINLKTSKCPLAHFPTFSMFIDEGNRRKSTSKHLNVHLPTFPLSPCLLMKEIEEDVFFLQIKSLFQL